MKTLIQENNGYFLELSLEKTQDGNYNQLVFSSYFDRAKEPNEPHKKLELFLTDEQFSVLCRSLNVYSLNL